MSRWHSAVRALWFALTILLSAFLVFQVQPVISKIILPWFGGTPAVWTTCVLFFQVVLFAGYAYAHVLTRHVPRAVQGLVHVVLLGVALFCLPISPDASWKPTDSEAPAFRILFLLLMNVGLPYFLLATTGPLLQAWFSRACRGQSPYRLYALSNIGSLLALLSYPLLFEPTFSVLDQDMLWSAGFSAFAIACAVLAIQMWRFSDDAAPEVPQGIEPTPADDQSPDFLQKFGWLIYPAIASMTLLATTNHVCQDVAVVPFLWVAPLALYLITFIICFDKEAWYSRRWMTVAVLVGVSLQCLLLLDEQLMNLLENNGIELNVRKYTGNLIFHTATYLGTMFSICMVCHGELVRSKPKTSQLTTFYMLSGAGGAVGGIFVGLVCPLLFATYFEMQLSLIVGSILAAILFWLDAVESYLRHRPMWQRVLRGAAIVACFLIIRIEFASVLYGSLATVRNFYGVLRVDDYADNEGHSVARKLVHGTTVHGFQFFVPEMRTLPTTYYSEQSGVGISIRRFQKSGTARIGVVGLGCGTLAAYGKEGDYLRFYEINPAVQELARNHFTFIKDSPAQVDIVLGDARLSLERESPQQFDVLVLDAFSSDAIPAHLLTKEAFEIYLRHLKPTGVIAVHTSNRHLVLPPVVAKLGHHHGMRDAIVLNQAQQSTHQLASQWVLLTRDERFLNDEMIRPQLRNIGRKVIAAPLWTDQFNNLYQILKFK